MPVDPDTPTSPWRRFSQKLTTTTQTTMLEKDYAPLSAACVRALNDKLYEKRKTAAVEIEKMVKDFVAANNTTQIEKLLKILGQDFANSVNPHTRKGGLIGLAAMAIALGKESAAHTEKLVVPVISNFNDADSRVRYYACEALYNVVKVSRGAVLPLFNNIFDALCKLAADPDQNVKNGCELLDRLMKDIVTESASFDLVAFMPLLRERIYSRNAFVRQFIVSWVLVLDAVPDIDMLVFLPDILDGLFSILGEPTLEIKKSCETVLCEFLRNIVHNPTKVDFPAMVNILIAHSQSSDASLQFTALLWIKEFVTLSGRTMLPFTSGILTAVLPSVAHDDEARRSIHETAKAINNHLMQLITYEDDRDSPDGSEHPDAGKEADGSTDQDSPRQTQLDLPAIVDVLTRNLIHNSMQTKVAALKWIYHLHIKIPNKIFRHVEEIFTVLLKTLSDVSDEVVMLDLEVLAEISSSPAGLKFNCKMDIVVPENLVHRSANMNSYFTKFLVSLLSIFSTDRQLLEDRGSFIVRQLCLLLHAEDIYRTLSEILLHEEDLRFARHMVQTLNTILLTSTELFELRNQLKDLATEESCSLFSCLYMTWCHNPVTVMSLCLLTQNYEHACDLLIQFADLEITVDLLSEIDKLVQLIESPIFTYLRLQLLDAHQNPHLVKSLYGLLMLLPQSEAFHMLRRRLNCVPNLNMMPQAHGYLGGQVVSIKNESKLDSPLTRQPIKSRIKLINFTKLLNHFQEVQVKHRNINRSMRAHLALDLS